jgi:hypothetical protein
MMHSNRPVPALMGALICACGSSSTVAPAPLDTGAEVTIDAPVDSGVDYGSCGRTTYDCLCACVAGDASSGCDTACFASDSKCTGCINDGVTSCCPVEYPAYNKCYDEATTALDGGTAPCAKTDSTCISGRCNTQAAALQTCLATPACKTNRAKCTGSYPATCGK